MSERLPSAPTLYILADDLIWATRLAGQGRTLGAHVSTLQGLAGLRSLVAGGSIGATDLIAIDTTTRGIEPIAAVVAGAEPEIAAKMRKAAKKMWFAEVPGIGHAPMLDEPEAKAAIFEFLAELD